jgi:anti-anti-sigma factor
VQVSSLRYADVIVVTIAGRVDHSNAERLQQALAPSLQECSADKCAVVLDCAGVEYISSMGLRVLMMAAKQMRARHARIAVANLQPVVHEIFEISRFNHVLEVFSSVEAALREVSASALAAYVAAPKPAAT